MEWSSKEVTVETKRYTMAELYELRRTIVGYSRSLPPGSERNQHRQIASSIRRLFRNKMWVGSHTIDGPQ